ncbi:MAG: 1-acyl-sn-glycerol-3-phosphate acyltransferase [Planctomycetales bacterium]|nr:1-acyl-sn-glycerol-3-phosphate acyltransferase [Planctomycetales bacterium]
MADRTLTNRLWYGACRLMLLIWCKLYFRLSVRGAEHMPRTGGCIVLSNHQSHLDPVLVGVACPRQLSYLARESLFRVPAFAWLIRSFGAIPIDRDGSGMAGLKATLRCLKADDAVLIFGEGTRSRDGQLQPLKPGFLTLARRTKVPILPVAVRGAFDAFPRTGKFPRPRKIYVRIGAPIAPEAYAEMSDEELLAEAGTRIEAGFAAAAVRLIPS